MENTNIEIKNDAIVVHTTNKELIDKFISFKNELDESFYITPTEYKCKLSNAVISKESFKWFKEILEKENKLDIINKILNNIKNIEEIKKIKKFENDLEFFKDLPDWNEFVNNILENMKGISIDGPYGEITSKQLIKVYIYRRLKSIANFSEPGTGKTISTLMNFFDKEYQKGNGLRLIVVCPINAIEVWRDEIINFTNIPEENVHVYREDFKHLNYTKFASDTSQAKVIIINYESVQNLTDHGNNKKAFHSENENNFVVFDEVHRVKSGGAHYDKSFALSNWGEFITILTGTPYSKEINEIKNLFKLNWNGSLPTITESDFNDFNQRIKPGEYDEEAIKDISEAIEPYYFKLRKKEDFNIDDANDYYDKPIIVAPHRTQTLIDDYLVQEISKLASRIDNSRDKKEVEELTNQLHKHFSFAQINSLCPNILKDKKTKWLTNVDGLNIEEIPSFENSPKIIKSLEYVINKVNSGKKIIVWMRYKSNIENFVDLLTKNGISSEFIHGDVKPSERRDIINSFNNNDKNELMVLVTNPDTLAESISLHKHVHDSIFIERGFSFYQWIQAKDRIHRVGIPEGIETNHQYVKSDKLWIDRKLFENLEQKLEIDQKIFNTLFTELDISLPDNSDDLTDVVNKYYSSDEIVNSNYNIRNDEDKKSYDNYDEFLDW